MAVRVLSLTLLSTQLLPLLLWREEKLEARPGSTVTGLAVPKFSMMPAQDNSSYAGSRQLLPPG
jgi:hypothetical protein